MAVAVAVSFLEFSSPWRCCVVKPPLRTKSLGTKVSDAEYAQLEALASARSQTISEFIRSVLLEQIAAPNGRWPRSRGFRDLGSGPVRTRRGTKSKWHEHADCLWPVRSQVRLYEWIDADRVHRSYGGGNGCDTQRQRHGIFSTCRLVGIIRFAQDGGGNVIYDRAYAPFGEPYDEYNNVTTNRNFTAQTEDTTPGLYDFLFRQHVLTATAKLVRQLLDKQRNVVGYWV